MIPVALKAKTEYPWECCGTAESLHFQRSELFDWRSIWNGFAPGMVPQRKDDWSCKIKLKNKSDFWTWGYAKYFSYYLDTTKKVWNWNWPNSQRYWPNSQRRFEIDSLLSRHNKKVCNWNSIRKGKILKFGYFWSCPKNSKQLFRHKLKWKWTF